ncbi:MAG: hypothetical protein MJB14_10375 [Spirochaetes bacterium]|nr:hypothetical protein [Spirochaetota bacterium]
MRNHSPELVINDMMKAVYFILGGAELERVKVKRIEGGTFFSHYLYFKNADFFKLTKETVNLETKVPFYVFAREYEKLQHKIDMAESEYIREHTERRMA